MTDQERSTASEGKQDAPKPDAAKKQLGEYRMPHSDIPPHFKEVAQRKLGAEEVTLHPARDQGGYKGKVIHADSNFVVQAVGAKGNSAVVHRASELEFVSNNLKWRADNGRLGSQNVQVHYDGQGKGKVYPFDPERAAAAKASRETPAKDAPAPTPTKETPTKAEPAKAADKPKEAPKREPKAKDAAAADKPAPSKARSRSTRDTSAPER